MIRFMNCNRMKKAHQSKREISVEQISVEQISVEQIEYAQWPLTTKYKKTVLRILP